MKFRSDEDGYITALRFYKQPNNTGQHVGHLWTRVGPAARGGRSSRTRPPRAGRRRRCPSRCRSPRTPPTSRRITPPGAIRFQRGLLLTREGQPAATRAGRLRGGRQWGLPLRGERLPRPDLQRDQLLGRRGVRAECPGRHPPAAGELHLAGRRRDRRAALELRSRRTFDEPLNPPTVNAGSFTLKDGAGNPVTAQVSLRRGDPQGDARRRSSRSSSARPTPPPSRAAARGSPTSPATSSRPTTPGRSARPPTAPAPSSAPATPRPGDAVQDQPVEVGMKFRSDEDGFITALRFYKQAEQHGHARRAPVVGHRAAARRGDVHQRDRVRLAAGRAAEPCADHEGHDVHHLLPRERAGATR